MEDTLRVTMRHLLVARLRSLNPCFNGRYSQRSPLEVYGRLSSCLNPCFNGRYSQSREDFLAYLESKKVLILVLMEDTLRVFLTINNTD